jgi:translocation and assembly module TamB
MPRRRVVIAVTAAVMLCIGIVALGAIVAVTQTDWGRGKIRAVAMRELQRLVHGSVYIGNIGGNLLTELTVDSIDVRDKHGEIFIVTGRLAVRYDPRDLVDERILLQHVEVEHPVVQIIHYPAGQWNLDEILGSSSSSPGKPKRQLTHTKGFGDYVVLDDVTVRNASVTLIEPWEPDSAQRTLKGTRRDSVIKFTLATDSNVVRWHGDVMREHRWRHATIVSPYLRIAGADSAGRTFVLNDVSADESDPAFQIRHVHGTARMLGDSLFLDLEHWGLPGSQGRGGGKVWWGGNSKYLRFALHIVADTASLADVAWLYKGIPHSGGGTATVDLHNEKDLKVIDVVISHMDIGTTASRIKGTMTFGTGGNELIVKDLNLRLEPMDFTFVQQLVQHAIPYDFQGQITGTVHARGGPVSKFIIDSAPLVFRDAHVDGAVSRFQLAGAINLLVPDSLTFYDLRVGLGRFDLRTIEYVNPDLPKLGGIITGAVTLDSVYRDLWFHNADLTHTDGDGEPTHVTGAGRITFADTARADTIIHYDLAATFDPLSFESLRPSYPGAWLAGTYTGTLRMRGTLRDLALETDLTGDADEGTVSAHGQFDILGPPLAGRGMVGIEHANLPKMFGKPTLKTTDLTVVLDGNLQGDSDALGTYAGRVGVSVGESTVDGVHVDTAHTILTFTAGVVRVDSLRGQSAVGALEGDGALGLTDGHRDSLGFALTLDSLGGLRRYAASGSVDSLTGTGRITGWLVGRLDSMSAVGRADATDLRWGAHRVHTAQATFAIDGLPNAAHGVASVGLDTLTVGGVSLVSLGADARVSGGKEADLVVTAQSETGPTGRAVANVRVQGDSMRIRFDSLSVRTSDNDWHLETTSVIWSDPREVSLDSLVVRGAVSGWMSARGTLPADGAISARLAGDSVPLQDLASLGQIRETFQGLVGFNLELGGTRADPVFQLNGRLLAGQFGDVRLDEALTRGSYQDRRLTLHSDLVVRGDTAVHALVSLPIDLAIEPRDVRRLDTDTISGQLESDSAKLATVLAVFPTLRDPLGWFTAHVDMAGTWRHPSFTGSIRVGDGAMTVDAVGVRWTDMATEFVLHGDSLAIAHASVTTTTGDRKGGGTAALTGWVTFADINNPKFRVELAARNFHAVDRPRLADITLSTVGTSGAQVPLVLSGSEQTSALTGKVRVDAATIALPDLTTKKQVVSLTDPELYNVIDTTIFANQRLLPNGPPRLIQSLDLRDVSIDLGANTWLKSSEANINLNGSVSVTTAKLPNDTTKALALTGVVNATRGTYVLNLGIVQRTFTVDQPGTISFTGAPEFNPDLDITAVNVIRQAGVVAAQYQRPEVRVKVRLSGTLDDPKISLFSDDSLPQSDLISYLVSGVPAYELSQSNAEQLLSSVVLPTLGSAVGSRLTGNLFTTFQVQTAAVDPLLSNSSSNNSYANALLETRIGAGKQIGPRTFVSADYGFCGSSAKSSTDINPANQLGIRVEQTLTNRLSLDISSQPATTYTYCTGLSPLAGFIDTPRQYGLDLFRVWRF